MPVETRRSEGVSQAGTWGRRVPVWLEDGQKKPSPCLQPGHSSYLLYDWVILFIGHTRGEPAVRSSDSTCKGERKAWPVSHCPADTHCAHSVTDAALGERSSRQTEVDLLSTYALESITDGNSIIHPSAPKGGGCRQCGGAVPVWEDDHPQ